MRTPSRARRDRPAARPLSRWLGHAAVLVAAVFAAGMAEAACTGIGVISCSATVSATTMGFGNYNPNAAVGASDTTSTVTVNGTINGVVGLFNTLSYSISLSAGASSTLADRRLVFGSNTLAYNLYTDSGRASIWGANSVNDSVNLLISLLGSATFTRNYTVYGRIAAAQYVTPGLYANTITVTVDY